MRFLACTLLLAAAGPALAAQTQPQPPAPPGPDQVASSPLSTSPTPADGPRAQQGDSPANNDAAEAGGGLAPTTPPVTAPPGTPVIAAPSPDPNTAFPPPAPLDHYPICKADQFDNCMEPGPRRPKHRRK